MARRGDSPEYSIASVSKLTGVGCHALRVWERRYGFPIPLRSPSGHRRYTADQVRTLLGVAQRLREGEALAEVMATVRAGSFEEAAGRDEPIAGPAGPPELLEILERLLAGDMAGAEAAYARAVEGLDAPALVRRLIEPGFVEVGERWFRGECDIYQEHLATGFFRRKLEMLLDAAQAANPSPTRSALVGTVQGDRHEGGVLMFSLLLELAGWRAHALGVDIPVREYQRAIDLWKPDAVCLSFVLSRNVNKRFGELARLRGAPIFLGGRSILNYQGLARRHGLRPLVGPGEETVALLIAAVEAERGVASR